jgi:hypothetical protein
LNIIDALVETGLAKSKGEARRTVEQGGAYINNLPLASSLIFSSNIELARAGLSKPLEPWRRTMIQRIHVSSTGDVVLSAVTPPTPLLPTYGLLFERDHWLNRAYAQFLHVRSVVSENTASAPE